MQSDDFTVTARITDGSFDEGQCAYLGGEYVYIADRANVKQVAFNFAEGKAKSVRPVLTLEDAARIIGICCDHTRVEDQIGMGPKYWDARTFYAGYNVGDFDPQQWHLAQYAHEPPSPGNENNFLRKVLIIGVEGELTDARCIEMDGRDLYLVDASTADPV